MRKIKRIEIDFGGREGTWTRDVEKGTTGGKPMPSEGQAHFFSTVVVPAIEKLANMEAEEIKAFVWGQSNDTL